MTQMEAFLRVNVQTSDVGTHWDKAGIDVVGPCSARFWQKLHSIVIVLWGTKSI